ncbi:MAG: GntR family transcriptional regulator [Rhodobacteraceae bacterium]|nr:GntR family transcriptional regulator [Paracoccaceae bacterium]
MLSSDPVSSSRVNVAYERLKADILANNMPAGFQAPEPEIAEAMGMSRTPVREALIRLQAEGLVELIPRRGARVLPIKLDDMRDIYDLLTLLEPHAAAAVAATNPTPETLGDVIRAMEDMEAALARDDLVGWAQADHRFHRALLQVQSNGRLSTFVKSLFDQAHRARMFTLRLRSKPVKSTQEHRAVLEAMLAGDAEAAHRLFSAHRTRTRDELLSLLTELGLRTL